MTVRAPFSANIPSAKAIAPSPGSQDDLASRFVELHGSNWRYVAARKTWYLWDGSHWRVDDTNQVFEAIRLVCRAATERCDSAADRRRIASRATIVAVERIAATDQRLAARPSDFDADPYLLNTPDGIIDLRTGAIEAHDSSTLMTRITNASFGSGCPSWRGFIDELTCGDAELARYLQRLCGYCLTGSTKEQVLVFLYGPGANGKSVFLRTMARILNSYAGTAGLATFLAASHDRHPTELAGLVGKRLVTVSETEAGRSWAESRIKAATGGEDLRVRFMHCDEFEYTPGYKLIFSGNHRPSIHDVGEAMRRRIHLVPLLRVIPREDRDPDLIERLLEERDGILGWMLDGCRDWQEIGLAPPSAVENAGKEYFVDEDITGAWIEDCCAIGSACSATASDLYSSWCIWAGSTGHEKGSQKTLGAALRERGFSTCKISGNRGWRGIGLAGGNR
jgi:putative DNA primase/helicase